MKEILFEFIPKGRHVRISAIDPETLTEAVVVGDARQSTEILKAIATKKLRYIIDRQNKSIAHKKANRQQRQQS